MNRQGNVVSSVVIAVPTACVMSLLLGILDEHFSWIVALAIAIVPAVLGGPLPVQPHCQQALMGGVIHTAPVLAGCSRSSSVTGEPNF